MACPWYLKPKTHPSLKTNGGKGWRLFGSPQLELDTESQSMEKVQLGYGLGSPILSLAEGERTITIDMYLQINSDEAPPIPQLMSHVFEVSLTGEEGWISPTTVTANLHAFDPVSELQRLSLTVSVPVSESPITAYDPTLHGEGYQTSWPVIRCLVKAETYSLETLAKMVADRVEINVDVTGVKDLIFQNDQSLQPADKPILPFGSQPEVGSNFYIGSKEVFSKDLTSISVHLNWQDPPPSFIEHYLDYGVIDLLNQPLITDSSFRTQIQLLSNRNWNTQLIGGRRFLTRMTSRR